MKKEQMKELLRDKEVIVLIDIDGVINSSSSNDYKTSYKGLPINVSKEVLDFLSDL